MFLSLAKTAELIAMPFGMKTRVGPRNHVEIPMGMGTFEEVRVP